MAIIGANLPDNQIGRANVPYNISPNEQNRRANLPDNHGYAFTLNKHLSAMRYRFFLVLILFITFLLFPACDSDQYNTNDYVNGILGQKATEYAIHEDSIFEKAGNLLIFVGIILSILLVFYFKFIKTPTGKAITLGFIFSNKFREAILVILGFIAFIIALFIIGIILKKSMFGIF